MSNYVKLGNTYIDMEKVTSARAYNDDHVEVKLGGDKRNLYDLEAETFLATVAPAIPLQPVNDKKLVNIAAITSFRFAPGKNGNSDRLSIHLGLDKVSLYGDDAHTFLMEVGKNAATRPTDAPDTPEIGENTAETVTDGEMEAVTE